MICGTDARYGDRGVSRRRRRAQGGSVARVLLAGPEKAVASRMTDGDSKPDGYLTAKIDAVAALSALLTRLGA